MSVYICTHEKFFVSLQRKDDNLNIKHMKTYTYEEVVERYGKNVADSLISQGEPTSIIIDPNFDSEHAGKIVYAGDSMRVGNDLLSVYFYLTSEETKESNLIYFDWIAHAGYVIDKEYFKE